MVPFLLLFAGCCTCCSRDVVLSSGRDGTVRRFGESSDGAILELSVTQMAAAWVALLLPASSHTALAALFHGSKLVFQSLASQRTIGEIDCGGGHRSWALLARKFVIYIKVSVISSCRRYLFVFPY